jgi:ATP-dependent exoDNAse (exonuclease V) beta subunit
VGALNNIFERGLILDPITHEYTLAHKPGTTFTSTTSFISQFFEKFDEIAIATKLCATHPDYIYSTVADVLAKWRQQTQDGTDTHAELEQYLINGTPPKIEKACKGAEWLTRRNWNRKNLFIEIGIYSEAFGISGTVDIILRDDKNDTYYLYDWKTNKKLDFKGFNGRRGLLPPTSHLEDCHYTKYTLQLSMYRFILEQEYGITVSGQSLLHLTPIECLEYKTSYLRDEIAAMLSYANRD